MGRRGGARPVRGKPQPGAMRAADHHGAPSRRVDVHTRLCALRGEGLQSPYGHGKSYFSPWGGGHVVTKAANRFRANFGVATWPVLFFFAGLKW